MSYLPFLFEALGVFGFAFGVSSTLAVSAEAAA